MGVVKNDMLNNEVDDWINSHDSEDMSFYESEDDDEYEEMAKAERKADEYYRSLLEEERNSTAHEFPGYDPNNVPKFTSNPTLGGCLSYLAFQGVILLVIYLIIKNL